MNVVERTNPSGRMGENSKETEAGKEVKGGKESRRTKAQGRWQGGGSDSETGAVALVLSRLGCKANTTQKQATTREN